MEKFRFPGSFEKLEVLPTMTNMAAGGGNEHELSPAAFGLISPGVAELISLASCGRLSHIPISLLSRCPPGDAGFSS